MIMKRLNKLVAGIMAVVMMTAFAAYDGNKSLQKGSRRMPDL